MNDLLNQSINDLQKGYLTILKSSIKKIDTSDMLSVIDEINVYWSKNKRIVFLILNYYCIPFDSYIFTGATRLGIKDNEHFSFLSIGKIHIMDDPLCSYIRQVHNSKTGDKYTNRMKEEVICTITDNIQIIEKCYPNILVLPVRYLLTIGDDAIFKHAEEYFLSMFDGIKNMDEYYKLNDIQEVKNTLLPNVDKTLVFLNGENPNEDLINRFNRYKESMNYLPDKIDTDVKLFLFAIYGFIAQALNILYVCGGGQLVPFIRSSVVMRYILILSSNFTDDKEMTKIVTKACVANILYNSFPKEEIQKLNFIKYIEILNRLEFQNTIFDEIKFDESGNFKSTFSQVSDLVQEKLDSLKITVQKER
jgi:hypothetical protein